MRSIVLLCAALLTACGSNPTVEPVLVPTIVKCQVEEPVIPAYRFSPPYLDEFSAVRDLLGDRILALEYENSLRLALRVCK